MAEMLIPVEVMAKAFCESSGGDWETLKECTRAALRALAAMGPTESMKWAAITADKSTATIGERNISAWKEMNLAAAEEGEEKP